MSDLLKGTEHRKPPDYELCRWVRYCYLLNRREVGIAVFNLILADNVGPALYREADRQARILKLRLREPDSQEVKNAPRGDRPRASIPIEHPFELPVSRLALPGSSPSPVPVSQPTPKGDLLDFKKWIEEQAKPKEEAKPEDDQMLSDLFRRWNPKG